VHASGTGAEAVRGARRVLVVRTDDLGDNILGGAFPGALARSIEGRCGLVGPPSAVELVPTDGLDFVAGVDCRPRRPRDVWQAGRRLAAQMRSFDPDVVVLPRFDFEREALAVALASVRPRTTVTWAVGTTAKRRRRSWWLAAVPGPRLGAAGAPAHELDRLRAFAAFVGIDPAERLVPQLSPRALDRAPAVPEIEHLDHPVVALGIGAAQPRRLWPAECFAALATELSRAGFVPVLLGSPDEMPRAERICRALEPGTPVIDLVGRLPLAATANVAARACLYVGNDSGLGHIAAAVGTPTVTISCHPPGAPPEHINAPERYRPVVEPSVAVRPVRPSKPECARGCEARSAPCCVTRVTVDDVVAAAVSLLPAESGGAA
jgi:ADP-heptose:LPS heptosyltransferase